MHIFIFVKNGENAYIVESRVAVMLGSYMTHSRGDRNHLEP